MGSFVAAIANVIVGAGIALASQLVIFRAYGVSLPLSDNIAITGCFTLISIARS